MLRYFADRLVPARRPSKAPLSRTISFINTPPRSPRIILGGPRKHQRLTIERRRSYFGFELETELETLEDEVPPELQAAARDVLAQALWEGETTHPDQNRLRRTLGELDELWRRSGGTLEAASPQALRANIQSRLGSCPRLAAFRGPAISFERGPAGKSFDPRTTGRTARSDPSPGRRCSLDYEVRNGQGIARVRLREGQAKRLRADELPRLTAHWYLLFSVAATHRSWPIQSPTFRRCFDDLPMLPTMRNTSVPIAVAGSRWAPSGPPSRRREPSRPAVVPFHLTSLMCFDPSAPVCSSRLGQCHNWVSACYRSYGYQDCGALCTAASARRLY